MIYGGGVMPDTKTKLIDATIAVLRDDGITSLSARVIASRAGVNQALVFYHFGTLGALIDAATRAAVDASRDRYREAFASASSLHELIELGGRLHEQERAAGNVALMAQVMAGAQHDPVLADAARYALSVWTTEVEAAMQRILEGSALADFVDVPGLARAVSAGFIGIELYDGVDPAGGAAAMSALTQLVTLADALDSAGPIAKRAVSARLRSSRGRA